MENAIRIFSEHPKWLFYAAGVFFAAYLYFRLKVSSIKKCPVKVAPLFYYLVYTDQREAHRDKRVVYSKLLYAERYGLKGKPDFIFKRMWGRAMVPVEIKSGAIKDSPLPHKGDLMQLAAYFLIIEEVYHVRPKYGRLVYRDYMFRVKNTRAIRKSVLRTLAEMRTMLKTGQAEVEPSFVKCRYCVANRTVCQFSGKKQPGKT